MPAKPITTLGLNLGTRLTGLAVIRDGDLRDWRILGFPGPWTTVKARRIGTTLATLLRRLSPDIVAIKTPHPSRSSRRLYSVIATAASACRQNHIPLRRYSIGDLRRGLTHETLLNKRQIMECLAADYPVLHAEFEMERKNRHPYHVRVFEAIGLADLAYHSIETPRITTP